MSGLFGTSFWGEKWKGKGIWGPGELRVLLHRVLGVLLRVLGVLHRVLGVPHRVLGVLHTGY